MPELSIVVPVYNEEASVAPLLEEIVAPGGQDPVRVQILFVDDGSTDGWPQRGGTCSAAKHKTSRLILGTLLFAVVVGGRWLFKKLRSVEDELSVEDRS